MKKIMILVIAMITFSGGLTASEPGVKWFGDARFGMFVHFGPYAVLGSGEWVMNSRPIKGKDYMRLQELFNPAAFDAAEWVSAAKNAGAKYITFTSRHHDGFSNWDTRQSDWNIMNTPYGKDLLRQLSDECKRQDIKLVLYYSTLDWMREDYQWETGRTGQKSGRTGPSDWDSYIAFMKAQITELVTQYDIAGLWFDGHWDQTADENRTEQSANVDWRYDEIYGLIKELDPNCLIANNHHLPPFPGEDYQIFERDVPGENTAGYSGQEVSRLPLETCQTINGSWGFRITDDNFKSPEELIRLLVRTAGMGANLLLNVGPMPNGKIQPEALERLAAIGQWTDIYGHTVYGTHAGPVRPQDWGAVTRKGNSYYIHVLDPDAGEISLQMPRIKSAKIINDLPEARLEWKRDPKNGTATFRIAGEADAVDTIVEVVVR